MKILLHAPLHISLWVYLMHSLPEHQFFIEPTDDFEQKLIPTEGLNYKVVPRERISTEKDYDVQIVCLHLGGWNTVKLIDEILKDYQLPVVFIEYWKTWNISMPNKKPSYPLISTCRTSSDADYPGIRYTYIAPPRSLWDEDWKGEKDEIFCHWKYESIHLGDRCRLMNLLQNKGIRLYFPDNRTYIFKTWKEKFVHNRAFLDFSQKKTSSSLFEAMTIGMPVIVRNQWDLPLIVRHGIDGFSKWEGYDNEMADILLKMQKDYDYAKEWGMKAKKRAEKVLDLETQRKVWNDSFKEAIEIFNSKNGMDVFKLTAKSKIIEPPCQHEPQTLPGHTAGHLYCKKCGKEL